MPNKVTMESGMAIDTSVIYRKLRIKAAGLPALLRAWNVLIIFSCITATFPHICILLK